MNCEAGTADLVLAFCSAPVGVAVADLADLFALTADEAAEVLRLKGEGNASFRAQDFQTARALYDEALAVYGDRPGSVGEQRGDKVKLLANLAEACLRLDDNAAAEAAAAAALTIDGANTKARLRRAKALMGLGSLAVALQELTVLSSVPEVADTKPFKALLKKVKLKIKETRKAENDRAGVALRQAFAAGGEGLGDAAGAGAAAEAEAEAEAESGGVEVTVSTFTLAALQKAHDDIPNGGVLRLPAGSYTGNGTFTISKPISIQGEGKESTVGALTIPRRGPLAAALRFLALSTPLRRHRHPPTGPRIRPDPGCVPSAAAAIVPRSRFVSSRRCSALGSRFTAVIVGVLLR